VKKSVTATNAEPETVQDKGILSSADDCHLILAQLPDTLFAPLRH
jgi:hypothetical protein